MERARVEEIKKYMKLTEKIDNLAVLVIDMQYGFIDHIEDRNIIHHQIAVLEFCIRTSTPVIVVESLGLLSILGRTICPLLTRIEKNPLHAYIQKGKISAFSNPSLVTVLQRFKATKLLIMGVRADCCVQQTAESAIKKGYKVLTSGTLTPSKIFTL